MRSVDTRYLPRRWKISVEIDRRIGQEDIRYIYLPLAGNN